MADDNTPDKDQKTLDPTEKRYEDAYKKGQIPISKDLNNFVFLLACLGVFLWCLPFCFSRAVNFLSMFISMSGAIDIASPHHAGLILKKALVKMLSILWIPFLALIIAAIAVGIGQSYKAISLQSIKPKGSHISIMNGFNRIFSLRSLVETAKSVAKIFI